MAMALPIVSCYGTNRGNDNRNSWFMPNEPRLMDKLNFVLWPMPWLVRVRVGNNS